MTKLFTLANYVARQLEAIQRDNPHLSNSKIINIALKELNHDSLSRLQIVKKFEELRGTLPNLTDRDYDLFQTLLIIYVKITPDKHKLSQAQLVKVIGELGKIEKQKEEGD